jgi:hypothetical protein
MLVRPDDDGVLLISQPAHAWVSGQLARAWTDGEDTPFEPFEEVCLAAEQHDIGWLQWEASPTLNAETGLPFSFREMPRKMHLQIWGRARRYAMVYGRYPALLISMHGTNLFEKFGPGDDAPRTEKLQVETYLRRERAAQQNLIDSLAEDPRYEELVDPAVLKRNQELISLWDGISLMICGGVTGDGVSMGDFSLVPGDEEDVVEIYPWPFQEDELVVFAEARRLGGTFDKQTRLHAALGNAEQLVLEFTLHPGSEPAEEEEED